MGLVSDVQLSKDMVMLQRAYNAESHDTCVFPMGKIADYCKSQKGSYGQAEDLGYAFTKSVLGSVEAKASYNDDKKDSCRPAPATHGARVQSKAGETCEIRNLGGRQCKTDEKLVKVAWKTFLPRFICLQSRMKRVTGRGASRSRAATTAAARAPSSQAPQPWPFQHD